MERSWKGRREYIFQGGVEGTTRCASVLIAQECVDIEALLFIHEQLESIESNATDIISAIAQFKPSTFEGSAANKGTEVDHSSVCGSSTGRESISSPMEIKENPEIILE